MPSIGTPVMPQIDSSMLSNDSYTFHASEGNWPIPVYCGWEIGEGSGYAGNHRIGGPYAQILYHQWQCLQREINQVPPLCLRNRTENPTTASAVPKIVRTKFYSINEPINRPNQTGFEQLMKYRPEHKAQLDSRSNPECALLFSQYINEGDYSFLEHLFLENLTERFDQVLILNNLLLALREG